MGLMSQQILDDAIWIMSDPDALPGSETVTYRKQDGTARTINAQVFRYAREDDGAGKRHRIVLVVANSSTYGIAATELNPDGDKVSVDYDQTGTSAEYYVRRPLSGETQDPGMLALLLE